MFIFLFGLVPPLKPIFPDIHHGIFLVFPGPITLHNALPLLHLLIIQQTLIEHFRDPVRINALPNHHNLLPTITPASVKVILN